MSRYDSLDEVDAAYLGNIRSALITKNFAKLAELVHIDEEELMSYYNAYQVKDAEIMNMIRSGLDTSRCTEELRDIEFELLSRANLSGTKGL